MVTGKFLKGCAIYATVIAVAWLGAESAKAVTAIDASAFSGSASTLTFTGFNGGVQWVENIATFSSPAGFDLVGNNDILPGFPSFGPLVVEFSSPVIRAGFPDLEGIGFSVELFDASNVSLGQLVIDASMHNGFFGFELLQGFSKAEIQTQTVVNPANNSTFNIDDFRLDPASTGPTADPVVPEPTTAILALAGLGALAIAVTRSSKLNRRKE